MAKIERVEKSLANLQEQLDMFSSHMVTVERRDLEMALEFIDWLLKQSQVEE